LVKNIQSLEKPLPLESGIYSARRWSPELIPPAVGVRNLFRPPLASGIYSARRWRPEFIPPAVGVRNLFRPPLESGIYSVRRWSPEFIPSVFGNGMNSVLQLLYSNAFISPSRNPYPVTSIPIFARCQHAG
jgi:hypothetical protein